MPHIPVLAAETIIRAGRRMDQRGWVPATAGNISVRIEGPRIAITSSGNHKGFLDAFSVIEVDLDANVVTPDAKPSAETRLHCQIYHAFPGVGAVLHGHSVANTVLSMEEPGAALSFTGYEVQKIFAGQTTHEATLHLPLVDNDQDMERLAAAIAPHLPTATMGYLIRGHGVYVWGPDMDMALARLEGLEFLLACALERRRI
jgi:methylthioribulose-1-phosphate dehydratase